MKRKVGHRSVGAARKVRSQAHARRWCGITRGEHCGKHAKTKRRGVRRAKSMPQSRAENSCGIARTYSTELARTEETDRVREKGGVEYFVTLEG